MCIAVVCDGVGGLVDGAFASSAAVRMLSEWSDGIGNLRRLGLQMRDAVLGINARIVREAKDRGLHTGTTLSALLLAEDYYYVVHTGDSRIYMFRDGALEQMTDDQARSGRLTACLGHSEQTNLFYNEGSVRDGRFLLCSDGLYKRMESALLRGCPGEP